MKLNNAEQVESIDIRISKDKTPIAFENKVICLMTDSGLSREEAEKEADGMVLSCEIYYEVGQGLFAVETAATEGVPIYSPYTREELEPYDED